MNTEMMKKTKWMAFRGLVCLAVGGICLGLSGCGGSGSSSEEFDAGAYFERPQAMEGLRFAASLRVEADLGWKEGSGRVMTFTLVDDGRQVSAILPGEMGDVRFQKGERYRVELLVRQGGLIEVTSARRE